MTVPAEVESRQDLWETLALDTLVWPYDPATGRILSGLYRGARVMDIEAFQARRLCALYGHAHATTVLLRPWWRLWRVTPARVLRPVPRGAEQRGVVPERSVPTSLSVRE
ncbi:hypothetical protein DAETH_47870 (plasmid) [Deinococcus aetherius]|uniref:Uncharacterized protein n=1 Tax=Deinococcus aetherius TaxID=200252 RepID=A0ABM8ALU2_9DEIO|nr:hypothetical protein [Deinococcus aetherius]BDP44818.1 hypothetical protein DAETH_47870 [Deinococcus aetherius]